MFWLRLLSDLLEALQSGRHPLGISGALALGLFIGLVPGWPLQVLLAALILLILDFDLTTAALGMLAGAFLGWLLDPALDALGTWLLTAPALQELWTSLYAQPLMRLTRFNNSVVLGSTLVGLLLLLPLEIILRLLLRRYYAVWHERLERLGLLRWLRWGQWLARLQRGAS